jgi:NADH dehydrogenase (ubiquinone) flavoprotein 2
MVMIVYIIMLQKLSRQLLQRTVFSFSGGYFSHRATKDNNDSTPFDFTADNYKQVEQILAKYPPNWKRSAIIPLLTLAQKQNDNFLSLAAMRKVARITEVNEMDVYEVASFYTMFNREKVGKFHLQVCGTTPCQLRGS